MGVKGRSGKSCRLRWCNQLNPDVKKDPFCKWEDAVIIKAHKVGPFLSTTLPATPASQRTSISAAMT